MVMNVWRKGVLSIGALMLALVFILVSGLGTGYVAANHGHDDDIGGTWGIGGSKGEPYTGTITGKTLTGGNIEVTISGGHNGQPLTGDPITAIFIRQGDTNKYNSASVCSLGSENSVSVLELDEDSLQAATETVGIDVSGEIGLHIPVQGVGECVGVRKDGISISNDANDIGLNPASISHLFEGGVIRSANGVYIYSELAASAFGYASGSGIFVADKASSSSEANIGTACPAIFTLVGDYGQLTTEQTLNFTFQDREKDGSGCKAKGAEVNALLPNKDVLPEDSDIGSIATPGAATATGGSITCETEGSYESDTAWLICEGLRIADKALLIFDKQIQELLSINTNELRGTPGYKQAWSGMRTFATVFIVITAFVMIFSTAIDAGIVSNYTVKKYLPRLVIGTIAIQASWVMSLLIIDFFTAISDGIEYFLFSPFADAAQDFSLTTLFESTVGAGAAGFAAPGGAVLVASLGLFGVLSMAWTVATAFLIGWFALVIRKLLIFTLVIMSPLGISLWILPGSDKAWGLYRKLFFILLYVEITMVSISAIGKIMAWITVGSPGGTT